MSFIKENYFLSIFFIFSLFDVLLSVLFSSLFGKNITAYYVTYLFYIIVILYLFWNIKSLNYYPFPKTFLIFFIYMFFVTFPFTVIYNSPIAIAIGIKDFFPSFAIALFMLYKLKNVSKINSFLRLITYGSLIASIYVLFELCNKYFPFFDLL